MKQITLLSLAGLGTLSGFMISTNPTQEEYVDFAIREAVSEIKQVCPGGNSQDWLREGCESMITLGHGFAGDRVAPLVNSMTTRENWLLFSIYTTTTPIKTFKVMGIGGNFVTLG